MLVKTYYAAVNGVEVTTVTIEVSLTSGIVYHSTGLGDEAVKKRRSRIAAAIRFNSCKFPHADITVGVAPTNLCKEGNSFDLSLAIAVLAASGSIVSEVLDQYTMISELSLDGTLQAVKGTFPIAIRVRKEHFKGLTVPKQNIREAAVVSNLEVYGMGSIVDIMQFLTGAKSFEPTVTDTQKEFYEHQYRSDLDYSDVRGQENVKRALEVATAGGHDLIMVGPPGSGKSAMAKRLPTVLLSLTLAESSETTQVRSVAGKLGADASLTARRPFRVPHHTISEVALVGGGSTPQPGEITLAHHGVLFCDELPELNKSTLEVLRQPLENRKITISRAKYAIEYPCNFMFVASTNPCPCGYYDDPTHTCVCTPGQTQRYFSKINGPLLDRIDIQCEITFVPSKDIPEAAPREPSADTHERVVTTRAVQIERYKDCKGVYCNTQMIERMIHRLAESDADGINILRMTIEWPSLSTRARNKILKAARTTVGLEGSGSVKAEHLTEAIGYRSLDKGGWAERQRNKRWV